MILEYVCERIHQRTITEIKRYNSLPQSVAIGYFNNDSLFDFVVVNRGLDSIDIYLGQSNGTFEHHTTYSTESYSQPCSVALGHLDNHHGIDIAVANFGTNSIGIFIGIGDGSFIFNQSLSTGSSHPLMIAVADLNNDHQLDIAVVNYGTNSVGIYLASQDGSFRFSINYPTGYDSLPKSLALADLNNDHRLDIVVANFGTDNIGLFFGTENETFGEQKIYSTGLRTNPSSVTVGDVNHDDYLDIIVANSGANDISIFFGDQNGDFSRQRTYSIGANSHPEFVALYDLNGDDQLDIIATDSVNDRVYILPGNKNGTFPFLSIYSTDFRSSPVLIDGVDMNNDNRSEVLIVNRDAGNVLLLMNYDVKLSAHYSSLIGGTFDHPTSIDTGDLNGDKFLDMVAVNHYNDIINVFLGHGDGSFTFVANISTGTGSSIFEIALNDFNNDHQLDIVVLNYDDISFSILLGYRDGIFSTTVTTYSTKTVIHPWSLAIGDVNNDHCLDIVIVGDISDVIGIYAGDCKGTFQLISIYKIATDWKPFSIAMDDFNNDNNADLVITYAEYRFVGFFFGDGTGKFPIALEHPLNELKPWFYIALGDFNNDNQTDVVASTGTNNEIVILFGYGNGTFAKAKTQRFESCNYPTSITVDDFNDDSRLDLAICCSNNNNIVILFGNNQGEFESQVTHSTGENSYPMYLRSGDFDNDNKLDIAFADYLGNKVGILISYYKTNFSIQSKYSTGSSPQPCCIAVADFNNDDISDLVVINSGTRNIGIRLGLGNGSFEIEKTYTLNSNSFLQHVNVADLNRDGQVDVVIADSNSDSIHLLLGNGDGTFENDLTYSMDRQSSPVWIVIANLNNDEWTDLVVANHGRNNIGILYGYNYATFVLHRTYSTGYRSLPGSVSVSDMNNDNRLDIVVTNELLNNIVMFLGDENGSFTNQITYSTGDDSHPRAMVVADMNNDTWLDIIVGNVRTHSLRVLLSNSNGTFENKIINLVGINSSPTLIIVGDLNNDNRLDVITTDYNRDNVAVFLGSGDGSLSLITTYSTGFGSKPTSIALGDLNDDNYLDMVVAHRGTDSIGVLLGYGNGSFAAQMTYPLRQGSSPFSITLADLNNDNRLDVAVANFLYNYIQIFIGFENGNFTDIKEYFIGNMCSPYDMTVDYFNDDKYLDIAVICTGYSAFTILFGTDNGDFLVGRQYATSSGSPLKRMATGDLNNDSHLDLVVLNVQDGTIDIFLQNGHEPFATPVFISTGFDSQPHSLAVGNFDHDNLSDIVVINHETDNIVIILSSNMYDSTDSTKYSTGIGSRPYDVVTGYFTNDNQLDLAVINSATADVTIFQGYVDGSFRAIGSYAIGIGSIPHAIVIADFNNDHRMDLAIANAGANNVLILFGLGNGTFGKERSYSMRYDSRPYSLAVGDFDRDGWMDIAVANFGADYVEILLQPC